MPARRSQGSWSFLTHPLSRCLIYIYLPIARSFRKRPVNAHCSVELQKERCSVNCAESLCLTVHCLVRDLVRSKTCFQAALGHLISMIGSYLFVGRMDTHTVLICL
jgi:hypothetical protein